MIERKEIPRVVHGTDKFLKPMVQYKWTGIEKKKPYIYPKKEKRQEHKFNQNTVKRIYHLVNAHQTIDSKMVEKVLGITNKEAENLMTRAAIKYGFELKAMITLSIKGEEE